MDAQGSKGAKESIGKSIFSSYCFWAAPAVLVPIDQSDTLLAIGTPARVFSFMKAKSLYNSKTKRWHEPENSFARSKELVMFLWSIIAEHDVGQGTRRIHTSFPVSFLLRLSKHHRLPASSHVPRFQQASCPSSPSSPSADDILSLVDRQQTITSSPAIPSV